MPPLRPVETCLGEKRFAAIGGASQEVPEPIAC